MSMERTKLPRGNRGAFSCGPVMDSQRPLNFVCWFACRFIICQGWRLKDALHQPHQIQRRSFNEIKIKNQKQYWLADQPTIHQAISIVLLFQGMVVSTRSCNYGSTQLQTTFWDTDLKFHPEILFSNALSRKTFDHCRTDHRLLLLPSEQDFTNKKCSAHQNIS